MQQKVTEVEITVVHSAAVHASRHGSNAALLVTRMIGLRNVEALNPEPQNGAAPAWAHEAYTDNEGRRWNKLKVRELLADEAFMDIGA